MADPLAGQDARALPRRDPRLRGALAGAAAHPRPQGRAGRRPAAARGDRRGGARPRHPRADLGHRHRRRRRRRSRRRSGSRRRPGARGAPGSWSTAPRRATSPPASRSPTWARRSCCSATATRARSTRWCSPGCARPSSPPRSTSELGIAHCLLPESLDRALARTPGAVAAWIVSPTYFGACADVRALAEVAHAPRRAADRRRGLGRAPRLQRRAARARARRRRRPRDLEHAQDRSAAWASRRCCTSAGTGSTRRSSTAPSR